MGAARPSVNDLRAALSRVAARERIDRYYLPVAELAASALDDRGAPRFLLLSGPQGSGKTTLAEALVRAFSSLEIAALTISLDDFYLTRAEQVALAARHPGNPALEHRGNAGTHDVELGGAVLDALRAGRPVALPRYVTV